MALRPGNGSGRGALQRPQSRLVCIAAAQNVIRDQRFGSYSSCPYAFHINGRAVSRRPLFSKRRFRSFERPAEPLVEPSPPSEHPFPEQSIDSEQQQVDDPEKDHHDGQNSRFSYYTSFGFIRLKRCSRPICGGRGGGAPGPAATRAGSPPVQRSPPRRRRRPTAGGRVRFRVNYAGS